MHAGGVHRTTVDDIQYYYISLPWLCSLGWPIIRRAQFTEEKTVVLARPGVLRKGTSPAMFELLMA